MIWKKLYYYDYYEVSSEGQIRSIDRVIITSDGRTTFRSGKVLKSRFSKKNPHHFVSIRVLEDDKIVRPTIYLQKAVADHFIKKPSEKHVYASNISKDYSDNRVENIIWITHAELIKSQPNRLANPTKGWTTRRAKYKNSTGSAEIPKWNTKKQWETKYSKYDYKKSKK